MKNRYKIQELSALEREMRTVARGERSPPADAAKLSFNSVEALVRFLDAAKPAGRARLRNWRS